MNFRHKTFAQKNASMHRRIHAREWTVQNTQINGNSDNFRRNLPELCAQVRVCVCVCVLKLHIPKRLLKQ